MEPGAPRPVTNPADGSAAGVIRDTAPDEIAAAFDRARRAAPGWAALGFAARGRVLRRLVRGLVRSRELVPTLIAESGKSGFEAEGFEVLYTAELTRFYTGRHGRRALAESRRHPFLFRHKRARVRYLPRGVVAVIGPWNFPLLNNFADCVAPLIAGNTVLLKPSELTPLTSLAVERLWHDLGLPDGVFQVVTGGAEVGRALVAAADMVFFTGSPAVGRAVARAAAERLVPAVLELGGKSAMIVLADADLEAAAAAAVWSAFAGSGQVCIRTERVLVEEAVADRFEDLCVEATSRLRHGAQAGEPGGGLVDVGAMTDPRQIAVCERQVADALARGARLRAGGARAEGRRGFWFAPTVLSHCTPDMLVASEETFGPILPILRMGSAEEALAIANRSALGLAGSVWSRDTDRALAIARRLETGSVCINDVLVHYFCVEAPLGGIKGSGLGFRHGAEALRQFCTARTIVEDHPVLGWLNRLVAPRLRFPYDDRVLRLIRWITRRY